MNQVIEIMHCPGRDRFRSDRILSGDDHDKEG